MIQSLLKNNKGFSLVEALIGVALIGGLGVVVSKTTTASRSISSFEGSSCRSVLTSLFTSLESQGTYSNVINYIPVAGNRVPDAANFSSAWTPGGLGLFPAGDPESVIFDQDQTPVLRNHKLIHGSVSVVNALYNEGAYSGQFAPYNVFRVDSAGPANANNLTVESSLDKTAAARNGGLVAQMKIEPYDIDTGAILPVAGVINVVPRGNAASQIGAEVTPVNGLTTTTGFLVTLRLTADGQPCTMSKKFQYDRDVRPPPAPTFAITRNTTTGLNAPARLNNCQAPLEDNSVTLTLNYTAPANMEPGSQFVCLDRSGIVDWRNGANNPMPHINQVSGWISQAPGGFVGATSVASNAPVFNTYNGEGRQNTAPANLNWVACDQLRICGVDPVAPDPFDGAGRLNLTLTYNNLPQDCKVAADVRAIDTARNASAVTALGVAHNLVVNPAGRRSCTERSAQVDNFTLNRSNLIDYYWNRYGDHPDATIKPGLIGSTNAMASNLSYHNGYTTCGLAASCQAAADQRSTPFGDLWFDWFVSGGSVDHAGDPCGGVQTCGRNFTGKGVPGINVADESNFPVEDGYCLGTLPAGAPVTAVSAIKPDDPEVCQPPIDGGWSAWSVGRRGFYNSGSSALKLTRTCTNPAPAHGGQDCDGSAERDRTTGPNRDCYSYTLKRTGGPDVSVAAKMLPFNPSQNSILRTRTHGTKTGFVCLDSNVVEFELAKLRDPRPAVEFKVDGNGNEVFWNNVEGVLHNNWYRELHTIRKPN